MAYWNRQDIFTADKPIIAFPDGVAAPYSVNLAASTFGYDTSLKKTFTAGYFIARIGTTYRLLPRALATAATTTSSPTVVVADATPFVVGDVLTTFDSTDAAPTYTSIGTISAINYATKTITLGANAAAAVANGAGVGVEVDEVIGVYPHSQNFDNKPVAQIAVVNKAKGVYKLALPYIDQELLTSFGLHLNIRDKF